MFLFLEISPQLQLILIVAGLGVIMGIVVLLKKFLYRNEEQEPELTKEEMIKQSLDSFLIVEKKDEKNTKTVEEEVGND